MSLVCVGVNLEGVVVKVLHSLVCVGVSLEGVVVKVLHVLGMCGS